MKLFGFIHHRIEKKHLLNSFSAIKAAFKNEGVVPLFKTYYRLQILLVNKEAFVYCLSTTNKHSSILTKKIKYKYV